MFKSKYLVTMLLAVVLLLASCGKKEETAKPKAETKKVEKKADITMGFIYIGPVGDGGWTYAQDQGRKYLETNIKGVKTIYKETVPEGPEVKNVIRNMVDQGATIISAGSFGYMDYVAEVSKEFPNVKFLHCSGYKSTENMANYFGRIYQPRFLSGLVAGLKTKTNKIGYVAAFEIPEVVRGINAFTLGVKKINPKAEVIVRWTHTWYDPAKEKEAAKALLDEDCDVISQHQDTAGPQQAAEEKGVWSIGYNSDMYKKAPNAYMTAPVWNWGPYYVAQVQNVIDNKWTNKGFWGGLKDGVVKLEPLTKNAPESAKKVVEEYQTKIINGEYHVFSGPIKDQAGKVMVKAGENMKDGDMLGMNWFVEGVTGKVK